jgi:hypothetical protein
MDPLRHLNQQRAIVSTAIALATLALGGCGSSGGKPAARAAHATATPAPAQTFTSRTYGFRVTLTKDWSETDAIADWDGRKLQGLSSPAFANFTDATTGRTLAAAAVRVPETMKLPDWRAAMVRAAPDFCSEPRSAEKTTLGGEPALTWTARCSDGYDVHKLAAVHGRHGYMLLLGSETANHAAADAGVFESMRRSFGFTT